jgi:hypothetical protein
MQDSGRNSGNTRTRVSRRRPRPTVTLVHAIPEAKARAKRKWRPRAQAAGRTEDRMVELLDRCAGRELRPEDVCWGGGLWR